MVKFVATAGVNNQALVELSQASNLFAMNFPAASRQSGSFVAESGQVSFLVKGSGFTYPPFLGGAPATGTVTSVTVFKAGAQQYQLSGFSLPLADLGDLQQEATFFNGNDTVTGSNSVDTLSGFGGNDTINGKGGNDKLFGVAGTDKIEGGGGNDRMSGGSGNDTFLYKTASFGKDVITDFVEGPGVGDKISFETSVFANFAAVKAKASVDAQDHVVITLNANNTITLLSVDDVADLKSNDFLFV